MPATAGFVLRTEADKPPTRLFLIDNVVDLALIPVVKHPDPSNP